MDIIVSLLKGFDVENLMPPLSQFLSGIKFWMILLMLVGPLLMLALGAMYYYKPPKEANFSWGFRTYVTMGSVEVWRFTQRLAGRIWMVLGGIMSAATLVLGVLLSFISAQAVTVGAVLIVGVELVLVVGRWIIINMIVLKFYDKEGNRRPGVQFKTKKKT